MKGLFCICLYGIIKPRIIITVNIEMSSKFNTRKEELDKYLRNYILGSCIPRDFQESLDDVYHYPIAENVLKLQSMDTALDESLEYVMAVRKYTKKICIQMKQKIMASKLKIQNSLQQKDKYQVSLQEKNLEFTHTEDTCLTHIATMPHDIVSLVYQFAATPLLLYKAAKSEVADISELVEPIKCVHLKQIVSLVRKDTGYITRKVVDRRMYKLCGNTSSTVDLYKKPNKSNYIKYITEVFNYLDTLVQTLQNMNGTKYTESLDLLLKKTTYMYKYILFVSNYVKKIPKKRKSTK